MSELIDNRARRIETLKTIIQRLHAGATPDEVREDLAELVGQCDAGEIAAMEQQIIAEGTPVEQITKMCDLHSQLVSGIVVDRPHEPIVPGHPVDTFQRENEAISDTVARLRSMLAEDEPDVHACRALFNELMDIEAHYQRKENLLFPMIERHGITGPSTVMWAKHDETRAMLGALGEAFESGDGWRDRARQAAGPALASLEEMIVKEEKILLPMALQSLTAIEWGEVYEQTPQFGYCIVDPGSDYTPPQRDQTPSDETPDESSDDSLVSLPITGQPLPPEKGGPGRAVGSGDGSVGEGGAIVLPTGSMTVDQLKAIFATLPLDITFVDADDRVRFFTKPPDRIFVRPLAVIGRKVHHCHPPASVNVVDRILDDFRSGRQDVAEFWIEHMGKFIHIRYFAVRDEAGAYLGCLELTQDLTPLRALEGERRLLEYD
jgi:DUF438 domain-containing protein